MGEDLSRAWFPGSDGRISGGSILGESLNWVCSVCGGQGVACKEMSIKRKAGTFLSVSQPEGK